MVDSAPTVADVRAEVSSSTKDCDLLTPVSERKMSK